MAVNYRFFRAGLGFILILSLFGCASEPDAIDRVAANLSSSHGMYVNGFPSAVTVPETATMDEIVLKILQDYPDLNTATNVHVLTKREVQIDDGDGFHHYLLAVLADTSLGQKVVVMNYQHQRVLWQRVYPAEP